MSKQAKAPEPLTEQQDRFCQLFIVDLNGTKAAIGANYAEKHAASQASRLLADPRIQARVKELKEKQVKRLEIKADDVLRELYWMLTSDIGQIFDEQGKLKPLKDIPKRVRRMIASVDIEELFDGYGEDRHQIGYTKKVRLWSKEKAAELLAKHLKLLTDKVEHTGKVTLEDLLASSWAKKDP